MNSNAPYYTAAAVASVGIASSLFYFYQSKQKKIVPIPEEWKSAGNLSHIYIYPIKSCGPIAVEEADCNVLGLTDHGNSWLNDRTLMVIDTKNNFITARAFPQLLLVKPTLRGSVLTLEHKDMEPCSFNLADVINEQSPMTATVWSMEVPVLYCGFDPQEWFSRLLDRTSTSFRLVLYALQSCRPSRGYVPYYKFLDNDYGALPDESSYNIINESSIEDLNTRLNTKVSHRNFRPNFVVLGSKALEEDNWKFIKIGNNVFQVCKPCTRCNMTTIDPETGVRNPEREPLNTLRRLKDSKHLAFELKISRNQLNNYRLNQEPELRRYMGNSPKMGLQLALRTKPDKISIGDEVFVA